MPWLVAELAGLYIQLCIETGRLRRLVHLRALSPVGVFGIEEKESEGRREEGMEYQHLYS